MSRVSIDVVMPARNRASMIGRAIRSAQEQSVAPNEIIVIDDASTDGTGDIARDLGATVITHEVAQGSGPARNAGIAHAGSEWIAFLDSDDEWDPNHVERVVGHLRDQVLVSSPARTPAGQVRGNPWPWSIRLSPKRMLAPGNLVVTSGTFVRRDTLTAVGGFRALPRAQDLDLWLRVLEAGPGVVLGGTTVIYYEHAEQASRDRDLMRACMDTIFADYADRPWLQGRRLSQARSRSVWDDMRAAQARGDLRAAAPQLAWIASRPVVWPTLLLMFTQRKRSGRSVATVES
jgi:glycosyltransferase involved in cell wall biosynthesis